MDDRKNHEQRIVELESNLERAALLGKQLLDQLSLKSRECDELLERSTKYEVQLDRLKQKLHSAEREADLAAAREENALKEIESLQEVCARYETLQRENRTLEEKFRLLESEKQRRIQTVAELEENLQEARTELSLARTQIDEFRLLEKRRESPTKRVTKPDEDDESDEDEDEALASMVEGLKAELENLREILKQNIEERELAVKRNLQNENKLQEAIEEMSSIERELTFHLNEKNRKISELNEEIEVLKAAETDPNRRGNSIFAEVEDRRIEVENKLIEARTRLKFADECQRRLRNQLAHCYASLQVMAAHASKADQNYVRTLEREVMRLRAELCIIVTRVANPSPGGDVYTEKDLQDNPLAGMLLSERRQNAVFRKKIEDLVLHEGKRTEEMMRLGSELRASQSEIEKLEKQRTILMMKLKEKQITETGGEEVPFPGVRTKVIKEVLTEVVQETEREKQNEQKLLASGKIEEAVNEDHGMGASTSAEPQTFREERESEENPVPQATQPEASDSKAVKFNVAAGTEKPKQEPKLRGRQVKVVKSKKGENAECKTQ